MVFGTYYEADAKLDVEADSHVDSEEWSKQPSETDLCLHENEKRSKPKRSPLWPWVLSTMFFSITSISLAVALMYQSKYTITSSEKGQLWVSKDFPGAREAIELQEVMFTGNTAFYSNGTRYIPNPSNVKYFGDPTPEIDLAWHELAGERDFLITEDEAKELWPHNYRDFWHPAKNGYLVGLDLFHTLHCLDNIRHMFHPEYYVVPQSEWANRDRHRDHCLDQIRQYVMCAGDMTPYGTKYYEGIGRNYADSDVVHTCRNFDKLRDWTRKRYHAGGELHIPDVEIWE